MNKKKIGVMIFVIVVLIGIGGKLSVDKRAKDLAELHEIQTDLANYLYNNYRLYTFNKEELDQLDKAYDAGKMTYPEYSKRLDEIAKYSDISKIEFTGFSVGPMNTLEAYLKINDVYEEEVDLDTLSAETNTFIYRITDSTGKGPYYIEKKRKPTDSAIPEAAIIYYEGGID
ncbi:hypothetical protein ACSFB8_12335 [Enterococcus faecalis]